MIFKGHFLSCNFIDMEKNGMIPARFQVSSREYRDVMGKGNAQAEHP